ncbi:Maf family protein [Telmatobacter bradus]|uniref:Maf family protein n=1 Tax=Telmatobacter bradus TaxID=474953 RepID=UPI003B43CD7B
MLVLASASPRRRALLAQCGYSFDVLPADLDESVHEGEDPVAYVTRLAAEKAQTVHDRLQREGHSSKRMVLGADTTVIVDGQILGKPADAADAACMLRLLAGRAHVVATGVALATAQGVTASAEQTTVYFSAMSEAEIAAYVATGEPMDKAGAYGIQGRAARFIPRIEGCYFNVVGLPLARVTSMIDAALAKG